MKTKKIKIGEIIVDDNIQSRTGLNGHIIDEYAEEIKLGAQFPPVDLFFDGKLYFLTDGFHRYQAFKKENKTIIPSIIHKGSRREAILYSVGVNSQHGIRRTNMDKQRAVCKLLNDGEWSQWSDGEIARRCSVSQAFVSKLRRELTENGFESPSKRKGADGRIIDTTKIGKESKDSKEETSSETTEDQAHINESSDDKDKEDQPETVNVDMDFSEEPSSPQSAKTTESSNDDEKGEDNEIISEEEIEDLLSQIKNLSYDLSSAIAEVNKILPQKGTISQSIQDQLIKSMEKINRTWTSYITAIDDIIDDRK